MESEEEIIVMGYEYINRPIEEEHLSFEDYKKLCALREAAKPKQKHISSDKKFNVGDNVWVWVLRSHKNPKKVGSWLGGYSYSMEYSYYDKFGGVVDKVNDDGTYNVSSSLGYYRNISKHRVGTRNVQDLSHINIPEVLKKITTNRLLNAYKKSCKTVEINGSYMYKSTGVMIRGTKYSGDVIKAELANREHIYSKNDIEMMNELKNKTKFLV